VVQRREVNEVNEVNMEDLKSNYKQLSRCGVIPCAGSFLCTHSPPNQGCHMVLLEGRHPYVRLKAKKMM
jgi:hypothetical protein